MFQDLALVPIMPVFRNFFLGREPHKGRGPSVDSTKRMHGRVAHQELAGLGVDIADVGRPLVTLSGGQRQCVALARAVHFGARILILDEPTSALGVRQAGIVLEYIDQAREKGVGVIVITHNPPHAYQIGDRFVILALGQVLASHNRDEVDLNHLLDLMSGHET